MRTKTARTNNMPKISVEATTMTYTFEHTSTIQRIESPPRAARCDCLPPIISIVPARLAEITTSRSKNKNRTLKSVLRSQALGPAIQSTGMVDPTRPLRTRRISMRTLAQRRQRFTPQHRPCVPRSLQVGDGPPSPCGILSPKMREPGPSRTTAAVALAAPHGHQKVRKWRACRTLRCARFRLARRHCTDRVRPPCRGWSDPLWQMIPREIATETLSRILRTRIQPRRR
mmetsp:Transcript_8704/g.14784  ORF Transcript_8704/g.14784 Transcript_8704/m.14784 type:complete len:229 (+) Transcript_8704:52-738(+)